jgi:hypothetical protein
MATTTKKLIKIFLTRNSAVAESPGAASILAELKSKLEKSFTSSLMLMQDKLERLSLACLSNKV